MILFVGVEVTHSPTCVVYQNSELLDDDSPHHHARSTLEVFVDGRQSNYGMYGTIHQAGNIVEVCSLGMIIDPGHGL
jgi:hypothetical protein